MDCTCKGWKENLPKIDNIIVSAHIHGVKYNGKKFVYCPWCGKKLEK